MANLIWLQGATDNGCSISFLNADQPDVVQVITKLGVNVVFHPTLNPTSGPQAVRATEPFARGEQPLDVLVVEGAVQRGPDNTGAYCLIGDRPLKDMVLELAKVASYTVALGTCAAFGGVAAAEPNPTGATGLQFHKDQRGGILGAAYRSKAGLPVINISGCPAHPDWCAKTLGAVLLGMGQYVELDQFQRPKFFYRGLTHWACPHNEFYDYGLARRSFGEKGCLFVELGCKGPLTHADCNTRLWNRQSSKTRVGSPCLGCTEPNFPDANSGYFFRTREGLPTPLGVNKVMHALSVGVAKLQCPGRLREEMEA